MQKALLLTITSLVLIISTGCSYIKFPGVYTLDIQQGNIVTQDMVNQLKPGMTKRQVRFVLGTPLIADTFEQDRWEYYYSLRDAKKNTTKETMTVFFKEDKLVKFTGDFRAEAGDSQASES
jgi:outer membrane protein assembly factor BamE